MKLGIRSKIYRNTASLESPTWVEIKNVSEMALKASWEKGDGSTRASRIKKQAKTMLDLTITGKIRVSNTDEHYIEIWEKAHSDELIDLLVLNGAIDEDGSRGYRAEWQVFDPSEDQNLTNVLFMDFELIPAPSDDSEPKIAVVSEGDVTYSDLPLTE